jgi:hypothetical protein
VSLSSLGTVSDVIPVDLSAGDSTDNDFLTEVDPSGFFYDTSDGHIVSGGDGSGVNSFMVITPVFIYRHYSAPPLNQRKSRMPLMAYHGANK